MVVFSVMLTAESVSDLNAGVWATQSGYPLMRSVPPLQPGYDWADGEPTISYPTVALVDLTTMEALVYDCQASYGTYEACIEAYL